MDKEIIEYINSVKEFLKKINNIKIEKAILFGSRIKGDYLEKSDLDVILISSDFKGIGFTDRINKIYQYFDKWDKNYPLEIICYTPLEFDEKKGRIGLVKDAVENGIIIERS
jgi:hypothetical protein